MALCELDYFSKTLDKHCSMNVLIPDEFSGKLGVLYLLHGLGNTYKAWCKWTALPRYHREQNFIIVMPDAHTDWYCNNPQPGGHAWEDHIIEDVIPAVERFCPAKTGRDSRVIAGMSMGGYGAMKFALKYPEKFSAVSAHASAFFFTNEFCRSRPHLDDYAKAIGMNAQNDLFKLAESAKEKPLPAIRFDCGKNDPLLESNKKFHAHLNALAIKHQFETPPGIHDWAYADNQITKTLEFAKLHLEK